MNFTDLSKRRGLSKTAFKKFNVIAPFLYEGAIRDRRWPGEDKKRLKPEELNKLFQLRDELMSHPIFGVQHYLKDHRLSSMVGSKKVLPLIILGEPKSPLVKEFVRQISTKGQTKWAKKFHITVLGIFNERSFLTFPEKGSPFLYQRFGLSCEAMKSYFSSKGRKRLPFSIERVFDLAAINPRTSAPCVYLNLLENDEMLTQDFHDALRSRLQCFASPTLPLLGSYFALKTYYWKINLHGGSIAKRAKHLLDDLSKRYFAQDFAEDDAKAVSECMLHKSSQKMKRTSSKDVITSTERCPHCIAAGYHPEYRAFSSTHRVVVQMISNPARAITDLEEGIGSRPFIDSLRAVATILCLPEPDPKNDACGGTYEYSTQQNFYYQSMPEYKGHLGNAYLGIFHQCGFWRRLPEIYRQAVAIDDFSVERLLRTIYHNLSCQTNPFAKQIEKEFIDEVGAEFNERGFASPDGLVQWCSKNTRRGRQERGTNIDYCSNCGKQGSDLSRCESCKARLYCGLKCQKKHWKRAHKKECEQLRMQRKSAYAESKI